MKTALGSAASTILRPASGGVVYVRTAFVESGGGTGTLNDAGDPYGTVAAALAALAAAYAGLAVTVAHIGSPAVENVLRAWVTAFSAVTFKGHGGSVNITSLTWDLDGAAGTGENAAPSSLTFDNVIVGTVQCSGGSGVNGAGVGGGGQPGGSGPNTITLTNATVVAVLNASGGAGGIGGDGDGTTAGGEGGPGGNGATINHDATSSATAHSQAAGAGGAGGADGGNGAGSAGEAGAAGSYNLI